MPIANTDTDDSEDDFEDDALDGVQTACADLEDCIRERPLAAVLGALIIGAILGRFVL